MNQVDQILHHADSEFEQLQRQYLQTMILRNCSERTLEYWAMNLRRFNTWCHDRGIEDVTEVTSSVLQSYRQYLFHHRNPQTNKRLKFSTQHCYLIVVRRWFTWLHEQNILPEDIGHGFEIPKPEKRLPTDVLTADEVESLINQADVTKPLGIRDRAILETFYSTGMRNSELLNLQLYDVDEDRQVVVIRQGKGKKDRVVPIGKRAIQWIKKYITDVRPKLITDSHPILFVNAKGKPFVRGHLSVIVRNYMKAAGIKKPGSCHLLRHTAATLMMENGADLRSLQQFLGHARLTTTQLYTHVSISRLQDVHAKTHPASRSQKRRKSDDDDALGCLV